MYIKIVWLMVVLVGSAVLACGYVVRSLKVAQPFFQKRVLCVYFV